MNYIKQLATPNQLVPSLSDDVQFNFRDRDDGSDDVRSAGFDFRKTPSVGDKFGDFANAQANGVITKANGDIVPFNQNKPWERASGGGGGNGPARKFVSGENLE